MSSSNGTRNYLAGNTVRFDTAKIKYAFASLPTVTVRGRVIEVLGPRILAQVNSVAIGDTVSIVTSESFRTSAADSARPELLARVVGFSKDGAILSPYGSTVGLSPGCEVRTTESTLRIALGPHLLGCVVNSVGEMLAQPTEEIAKLRPSLPPANSGYFNIDNSPPAPLLRKPVKTPLLTGIRVIDSFITLGAGQRLCVLAEPGVGKSTLIGQIARTSLADINVIGLIGERGREVTEFVHDTLAPEARAKTVVVVSTSDEPAIARVTAANAATRIAEYFRDLGLQVLLQIDSLTRLFRAYREVGLAAGELPVRRGYPPSVFAELPRLIERAGTSDRGSITALYTVLLSSDLDEDPMVDEVKGLTDGHLVLRRQLAERGHYPAVDVLASLSRLASKLQCEEHSEAVKILRKMLSRIDSDREMLLLGGTPDAELKKALEVEPRLLRFLQQSFNDSPQDIDYPRVLMEALTDLSRI